MLSKSWFPLRIWGEVPPHLSKNKSKTNFPGSSDASSECREIIACLADAAGTARPLSDFCFANVLLLPPWAGEMRNLAAVGPGGSSRTRRACGPEPTGPKTLDLVVLQCVVWRTKFSRKNQSTFVVLFVCCYRLVNSQINFLFFLLTRTYIISASPKFVQQLVTRGRFPAKFYPFSDK